MIWHTATPFKQPTQPFLTSSCLTLHFTNPPFFLHHHLKVFLTSGLEGHHCGPAIEPHSPLSVFHVAFMPPASFPLCPRSPPALSAVNGSIMSLLSTKRWGGAVPNDQALHNFEQLDKAGFVLAGAQTRSDNKHELIERLKYECQKNEHKRKQIPFTGLALGTRFASSWLSVPFTPSLSSFLPSFSPFIFFLLR